MKLEVKKSSINNKGVFAKSFIKKGERICFLKGKEKTIKELKKIKISKKELGNLLQISQTKYLKVNKPHLFFNHSCSPNVYVKGKNELSAIRDIKKGEEITFDYSTTVWEDWGKGHKPWRMKCNCKSEKCRKIIKEFHLLPKRIKFKYIKNKFLPNFILNNLK